MVEPSPPKENISTIAYEKGSSYELSGKIMLSAIVILFFVVVLMVCLHLYARWYLLRARRRQLYRNRNRRRTQLVFHIDPADPAAATVVSRGLEDSVINSLPVFTYESKTHPEPVECAVCLSEFEDGETGRVLPKCDHSFHIECIDMWFQSHSTCPLCRTPVEAPAAMDNTRSEVVINVCEPGSSSGLCAECENEGEDRNRTGPRLSASSSFGLRRKPSLAGMTIEVPSTGRNDIFNESNCDSPLTQLSFRSPMGRMLSFKRIISRDRKSSLSPTSATIVGSSSMTTAELEMERVGRDATQ